MNISKISDLGTVDGKILLAEEQKGIIANVQRKTISNILKNTLLSGNPDAGTLSAKRFASAQSKNYGSARANGKSEAGKAKPVAVDIDTDKEIFEEYEEKDIALGGIDGLLAERRTAIESAMVRDLDTAFFALAVDATKGGSQLTPKGSTVKEKVSELIMAIHTTKNQFVDGVEKTDIHIVLSPEAYEEMRDYIDSKANANVQTDIEEFGKYHGVWVYSNVHQPAGVEAIGMVTGSIAQPVLASAYRSEQIPFSDAYNVGFPYYYGTKAVMPDLIQYIGTPTPATDESVGA